MSRKPPFSPAVTCHTPKTNIAITSDRLRHHTSRRMVARGRKIKSRIQNESDICHRVQKTDGVVETYGRLKFSWSWMPNRRAAPITMCEYPQKLKYSWNP